VSIETPLDLEGMRRVGAVVARTLRAMRAAVAPGVTTAELDAIADRVFTQRGARSAPRLTYGFPGATCICVDDEVVHGIPGSRPLRRGNLLTLDVAAELDGYVADAAITVPVGPPSGQAKRLLGATQRAMWKGIGAAVAGRPVSAIGEAVLAEARRSDMHVLEELVGHGVGRGLHESPSVPNVPTREARSTPLTDGLVLTVEPMLSPTCRRVVHSRQDRWTILTADGSLSAHFEHTVVIRQGRPLVVTA
jgi:methionyl aminopeptidase